MAFGFSPKHKVEVQIGDITKEYFLLLGVESARKLGWSVGIIKPDGFIAYTQFSMSSWSEEIVFKIDGDKVTLKSECSGNQLFDWGKNKRNIEHLLWEIKDLKEKLPVEEVAQRTEELNTSILKNGKSQSVIDAPYQSKGNFKNFFSFFIPTENYFITPIIIDLNIAVFVAMALSGVAILLPDGQSLVNWGANFRPVTLDGQPWRLLTSCFVHIGIIHLLMNMYALVYVGILLEPQLGKARFAAAYLFTGIIASTTSLWWHDATVSAGASGAIFGLYGVFLSMLTTDLIEKSARKTLLTSVLIFVGYNLVNGLKDGIDNAAHIGGLLSGLLIGFVFIPSLKANEEEDRKTKALAFILISVIAIVLIAYRSIPNDYAQYDKRIKEFVEYESLALDYYSLPPSASDEEKLSEINDRGIYYWNKCLKLIEELDKLNVPESVHERDRKLIEYCQLRIKTYGLFSESIKNKTNQYQPKIDSLSNEVEGIIKSISNSSK